MSVSQYRTGDAGAFQLLAALDAYEEDVDRLVGSWPDKERYRRVSGDVEEIRRSAAVVSQVAVPWAHLLIAHTELMHCLWKEGDRSAVSPLVQDRVKAHSQATRALHEKCVDLLANT